MFFLMQSLLKFIPTQDKNRPKADGRFLSKLVYKFRPAKNLCTYKDIFFSFKHPIGGGQQRKNGAKSSKPQGNCFRRLGNFFCRLGNFFGFDQFLPSNELSNIPQGVVNSKNHVRNPLNLRGTVFADQETFFANQGTFLGPINFFVLMSFQTSHRGWPTAKKRCEIV